MGNKIICSVEFHQIVAVVALVHVSHQNQIAMSKWKSSKNSKRKTRIRGLRLFKTYMP